MASDSQFDELIDPDRRDSNVVPLDFNKARADFATAVHEHQARAHPCDDEDQGLPSSTMVLGPPVVLHAMFWDAEGRFHDSIVSTRSCTSEGLAARSRQLLVNGLKSQGCYGISVSEEGQLEFELSTINGAFT